MKRMKPKSTESADELTAFERDFFIAGIILKKSSFVEYGRQKTSQD